MGIGLATRRLFPNMKGMLLEITEELIARQTPEAQAIIRALLDTIRLLQDQLNRSPRNSSLPPSTQHPHAKPPRPKTPAARRPGGQPGHPRQERPLLPTEQCDDVIPLKPAACRRCGRELSGEDAAPLRHQVWELPEIKPQVIEYQRHHRGSPWQTKPAQYRGGATRFASSLLSRRRRISPSCACRSASALPSPFSQRDR